METQKIGNLLNGSDNEFSKFATRMIEMIIIIIIIINDHRNY